MNVLHPGALSMTTFKFKAIISDANVLIDYAKANKKVLQLAAKHLCEVYVPTPILKEVKDITGAELQRLGVVAFEPTLEQVVLAADRPLGLSFEDQLCFLIAKEQGWTCATNDKQLRNQCVASGVPIIWGLEIMLCLNKAGHLNRAEAEKTAEKICEVNKYIGQSVIKKFVAKLS